MRSGDLLGMVAAYAAAGKIGQLPRADIINLANAMVQQAKFDDAHKFLDAEIAQDRNFADALFTKGIIFSVQGQCKKAVEFYGRALFVDAKMAPAYTNMGYARLDCNEIQEAVKAFETALKLSDNKIDHFDSNLGLAIARMRLGNESAAEEHFRKALTLNPVLAGGVESLARAGYVYSAPQAEDIRKLLEKHKTSK
jgi:superkiller protein 3